MLKILRHKGSIINLRYFGGLLTEQVLINISGPLLESEPVYGFTHGYISVLENTALFTGYQGIHTQRPGADGYCRSIPKRRDDHRHGAAQDIEQGIQYPQSHPVPV